MQKLIHKLEQKSRMEIAINYANDKFKNELKEINDLADKISSDLIENYKNNNDGEKFDELCLKLKKMNISNRLLFSHSKVDAGLVAKNLSYGNNSRYGRSLPVYLYIKNNIKLYIHNCGNLVLLNNCYTGSNDLTFNSLIEKNNSDDLCNFIEKTENLKNKIILSYNACYELLKKVSNVELLIRHWPIAFKYLPENMSVEEPTALSMSDKFKLL